MHIRSLWMRRIVLGLCSEYQIAFFLECSEHLPFPHGTYILFLYRILNFGIKTSSSVLQQYFQVIALVLKTKTHYCTSGWQALCFTVCYIHSFNCKHRKTSVLLVGQLFVLIEQLQTLCYGWKTLIHLCY